MHVSKQNILPALLTGVAVMSLSSAASAQACCSHTGTHTVNVPGVSVGAPAVSVTAPTVSVTAPSAVIGGSGVTVNQGQSYWSYVNAGHGQTTIVGGGYYYDMPAGGPNPGVIDELAVEAGEVCTPDQVTIENRIAPVQAVCIDDKGKPHPASRWSTDTEIKPDFSGEVYRCLAGSRLHATIGKMEDGKPVFDGGQTIACQKKEALVHENGQLMCKPESPQRDCNERSLLRRNGPGMKTLMIKHEKTIPGVCKPATSTASMVLDGGVGH